MRISPLLFAGVCLGLNAQASPLSDRTTRTFREADPLVSNGLVLADIVVAYDEPTGLGIVPNTFLPALMRTASEELSNATGHAVQLGRVTIVPTSPKSDPDILIVKDCPAGIVRESDKPDGVNAICADAHTGGYLGVQWWNATEALATGSTEEVFKRDANSSTTLSKGARIIVTWSTLKTYGAAVLVHEFGHYLFAMRDEYQATRFTKGTIADPDLPYLNAAVSNPNGTETNPTGGTGIALATGSEPWELDLFTSYFNGYGMGKVTNFLTNKRGYSPKNIAVNRALGTGSEGVLDPGDGEIKYWVPEQFATAPTRGNGTVSASVDRHGGLWSVETSIRTALKKSYTLPALPAYVGAKTEIDSYFVGQGNIFVIDRSGTMSDPILDPGFTGLTKWDLAMDFFGNMTHIGGGINYSNSAKFGVVAFDDIVSEPEGMEYAYGTGTVKTYRPIGDFKDLTVTGATSPLTYKLSSTAKLLAPMGGATNLVGGLQRAKERLDEDLDRPYMRNVILVSDGLHNWPVDVEFKGDEGQKGGYRVFAVTVDTKLDDVSGMGEKMQALAKSSSGPDGSQGAVFFTSDVTSANGQLRSIAQSVNELINKLDNTTYQPSILFRDAAAEYSISTDAGQTTANMSLGWTGAAVPTLYITKPNGQTVTEAGETGITLIKSGNFKSFQIDLTKAAVGKYTMRVVSTANQPITIFPTTAIKSTNLQLIPHLTTEFAMSGGQIPVSLLVQDGRPIVGLDVVATLMNATTGVSSTIPLVWKGAGYSGTFTGTLQPGQSEVYFTVTHPNNGKVKLIGGENGKSSQMPQYPYFQPRKISQQILVGAGAQRVNTIAVEAWTKQEQESFAQGTNFKLFLKNKSSVALTGLKARYFFSVAEIPGGAPGWSVNYMPGQPTVKVGTVSGRPGLAYVEFSYAGKTLQPNASSSNGTNGGDQITVIDASWRTPWNPGNDYSYRGLKTTWGVNSFVNIYDASGKLISGNPDLDPISVTTNSQPIVDLVGPDLVVAGQPATFKANAADPDGNAMTIKWYLGTTQVGTGESLTYSGWTAGAQNLSVVVDDAISPKVTVVRSVQAQAATGACTEATSIDLGSISTAKSVALIKGTNCFAVKAPREWSWKKIAFQANSSGVALTGVSVQTLPVGSVTNLSGYTQTVLFSDPGFGKSLYLKVVSNAARTATLNWWLQ
jgi:hypothetical protein